MHWAQQGTVTGASASATGRVTAVRCVCLVTPEWQRALLTDPQTSGGLLVACAAESEAEVLAAFRKQGFDAACRIGQMVAGKGVGVERKERNLSVDPSYQALVCISVKGALAPVPM